MTLAKHFSGIRIETNRGGIRTTQVGRIWEQCKHLQQGFEHTRGVRLFYYNGTMKFLCRVRHTRTVTRLLELHPVNSQ